MKKKILSLALALVMCLSLTVPALAAYEVTDKDGNTFVFSTDPITMVELDAGYRGILQTYVLPDDASVTLKDAPTDSEWPSLGCESLGYDFWDTGYGDKWGIGVADGSFSVDTLVLAEEGLYRIYMLSGPKSTWEEDTVQVSIAVTSLTAAEEWNLLEDSAPSADTTVTGAYEYDNGKCVYALSNVPVGKVYDEADDLTLLVVPDNTTVTSKTAPAGRLTLLVCTVNDDGAFEQVELQYTAAGEPLVVAPFAEDNTVRVYQVWSEDLVHISGELPTLLDSDNDGICIMAQSAAEAAGLTILSLDGTTAPDATPSTPVDPAPSTPATPSAAPGTPAKDAVLSPQKLSVDGKAIDCEKYNIGGSNYFKLRDLAQLLSGTGSQFSVDFVGGMVIITTGEAYTPVGGELVVGVDNASTAQTSAQAIVIDGVQRTDLTVYNIGGSNFFQLRELGAALGFTVDFDADTNTAVVTSASAQ